MKEMGLLFCWFLSSIWKNLQIEKYYADELDY